MARRNSSSRKRGRPEAFISRSVVCAITGITEQQLMLWEYEEFVAPAAVVEINGRSEHVYDAAVLERIRTIQSLTEDLGVNLPGIGVALHLLDRLQSR
jgi:DNA-binding transcriptional MerR regulator